MDYDLSRLSWRSFEQLVQALAVRHFGPGVVVFGDGSDGGREATFRGATSFAPHGTPWDGAGVVQAKFRQRPLGTEIDGPWAVRALDGELEKFARRAGGRPRPDYVVFATNAVLSPQTGGTKDQAIEKLEGAKATWGLRDYDIWDYDKLRTWLDLDEEVRTQFGWITAGDVLAKVVRAIEGATPAYEQAIVNYLEKTLIADRFVRLEEAGHSAEQPTTLSSVFVDLPVDTPNTGEDLFISHLLERTTTHSDRAETDEREAQRRIVLVGGPGQGKTTLGQFACQIYRAGLLAARPQQRLSPEGREAVMAVQAACDAAKLPFGQGPRFPLHVVLTDLAKALAERREQSLLGYLAKMISERVDSSVPADLFRRWLGAHPWFLVLDGLDEVPASAGRERVMRCVTEFWVDAAQIGADVVVLATTRPQGYNNDFSPDRYEHLRLAELSAKRALDYGFRLAQVRYGTDSNRATRIKTRLARAADDPTTAHLMRSPLQVAIMTALVDRYGQPPHERWSLFNAYYDVIYQRERERDTDAAAILREYRPDIDAIHQHVGLALQVLTTHEGHADPRLTTAQLERIIDARLASEGHEGPESAAMAAQIRAAAELRLVFLVGAESDRVGFEIRSLQEFMAAGALVDGPDRQVIQRLSAIAPLPAWRNVLLLAAGECFVRKQHLRAQLHDLCRELDVDGNDPLLAAAKTGARLALDLLEDRTARRQPKQHRVIAKHALEALDLADKETGLWLASCHDENVDDLYRSALADAVTSADQVRRTGARRCLVALHSLGVRWAGPMLHDHLPSTATDALVMLDELPVEMVRRLEERDLMACIELLGHHELSVLTRGVLRHQFPRLRWTDLDYDLASPVGVGTQKGLSLRICSITRHRSWGRQRRGAAETSAHAQSPTIAVYRAADRFLARPTRGRLSDVLEDLARQSTPEAWRLCALDVPWPLGVQLARAGSAEQLMALSESVRAGAYDDRADWLTAEKRWFRKTGVPLIDGLTSEPVPFPVEVATISVTYPNWPGGLPWLQDFRALPKANAEQRAQLAGLMLWAMGTIGAPRDPRVRMSDVIDVIRATGPGRPHRGIGIGILDADEDDPSELSMLLESLTDDTRIEYRGQLPSMADSPFRVDAALIERLERAVIDHPSARSTETLAVALAFMDAPLGRAVSVAPGTTDGVARSAAAFIAFVTGDRSSDARELGRRFAIHDGVDLWSLLKSPVAQSTPDWAQFLVGLRDGSPRTWRNHAHIDQMIEKVLSQRGTPLDRPETWHKLGLFAPHPLTLTEAE